MVVLKKAANRYNGGFPAPESPLAILLVYFIIAAVLALIALTLGAVVLRRLYMDRKYRRLDVERERFSTLPLALERKRLIAHIGPYMHRPGSEAWTAVEENLFRALEEGSRDEAKRLFDKLGYAGHYIGLVKKGNRWEQAMAAERLGRMGCSRALPALKGALGSPNTDLKLMAIHAVGLIGDGSALPALVSMLKRAILTGEEVSKKVLASSIISFGAAASRELASALTHPDWRVRSACLDILGETCGATMAPLFMKMLSDPEQDVRAKAAKGLGRIRCMEAAPRLEESLFDRHWVVRLHSARSLGYIKEERSVPALARKLSDRNWQVRKAAAEALGSIGESAYLELLKAFIDSTDHYAREQALDELGRSGAAGALLSLLPDGAHDYLLLREVEPSGEKGGIRMELLVDMLMFLSALDADELGEAVSALQGAAGGLCPRKAMHLHKSIRGLGSRGIEA